MKSFKEALDEFDWDDKDIDSIDSKEEPCDDDVCITDKPSIKVATPNESKLEKVSVEKDKNGDDTVAIWFKSLMSPDECEDDNSDEASEWVKADESLALLNAKEAKLREALRAVRRAKARKING